MPSCAACGTMILWGGVTDGANRYCNARCHAAGTVDQVATHVPDDVVENETLALHAGNCPKCGGAGPVDFHRSHRAMSFLIMTRWSSQGHLCCRSCATKAQLSDLAITAAAGWWGFPWGFIFTPIQICRNIAGVVSGPSPLQPSAALREHVRTIIAYHVLTNPPPAAAPPPLPGQ